MQSYIGIFKTHFKGELQYRARAFSGLLTQAFWGMMYVYLYTAFMRGGIEGFSISQMTSYIWLGQAFFALRYVGIPKHLGREITSGDICYRYTRPVDMYNQWYAEYLGEKLSATLLRCLPIVLVTIFLPSNVGLSLPVSFLALVLALVALIIGALVCCSISMIAVFLTFKTLNHKGSTILMQTITGLLGGLYIPIPLMPQPVQRVLMWLPFRYVSDLSFRIYVGNIGILAGLTQIGIALAWLVILVALGRILMNAAIKKTVIQGG